MNVDEQTLYGIFQQFGQVTAVSLKACHFHPVREGGKEGLELCWCHGGVGISYL